MLTSDPNAWSLMEADAQNLVDVTLNPDPGVGAFPSYFCTDSCGRPTRYTCVVRAELTEAVELADARARLGINPKAYEGLEAVKIRAGHWCPVEVGEAGVGVLRVLNVEGHFWNGLLYMRSDVVEVKSGDEIKRKCRFRRWNFFAKDYEPEGQVEVLVGRVTDIQHAGARNP